MNTRPSCYLTAERERLRYVSLVRFLNKKETENRTQNMQRRQLQNLLDEVEEVVKKTEGIRTAVHTPELNALVEIYKEIVYSPYMTSTMYGELLEAIEGTRKIKNSENIPINLGRMYAEFWGITHRKKAVFRQKDIKDANDTFF